MGWKPLAPAPGLGSTPRLCHFRPLSFPRPPSPSSLVAFALCLSISTSIFIFTHVGPSSLAFTREAVVRVLVEYSYSSIVHMYPTVASSMLANEKLNPVYSPANGSHFHDYHIYILYSYMTAKARLHQFDPFFPSPHSLHFKYCNPVTAEWKEKRRSCACIRI